MRGMQKWMLLMVARPDSEAANQPLPQYGPRRKLTIERFGTYTRVVLATEDAPPVRAWTWA